MIKVKDLTDRHCIHCPTQELAITIDKLCGCKRSQDWGYYKEEFCVVAIGNHGNGTYGNTGYFMTSRYIIIEAEEFIRSNQEINNHYEIY